MAPSSREKIEQMAFMAMMDGIIHTSVPCTCATCKSDGKSRGSTRPQPAKRSGSDKTENTKPVSRPESSSACGHNHTLESIPTIAAQKLKKTSPASPNKGSTASSANPGRNDKVNALLKADNVQAVFDVFNLTSTTKDEKDLATRIQNATKDCKLYQETKDKILELCDDEELDLDAVFGLLTKFRYERNMLTTAVIKGNSEREKALLCIQRVDHLMYMLQDVAKKKDSKGNDVMHKLGDIIMEIHDLAKTPSTLYDEFLDIKEEHFDLLNDHEDMHQKFVDVNTCHEKLHASHDKLQTEHTKLLKDFAEAKKKASTVGSFKNDVSRLEKAVDKTSTENADLKKEVERLNAELAKVNALKHENAQLKKKITTLSTQPLPPAPEETVQPSQAQGSKKKKGKKGVSENTAKPENADPSPEMEVRTEELDRIHKEQLSKLKKAHDAVAQELDAVKTSLKHLDGIARKAESSRDQAIEKLQVEKATSQNWKDIAKGHSNERDRLKVEVDRHMSRATKFQTTVAELEQSLNITKTELSEQVEAYKQVKEELEHRSPTPAVSITSQQTASLNSDTIRLLRKIRSETSQLVRDLDDSQSFGGDIISLLEMIQLSVRHVATEVERDIEEILSVKGNDPPVNNHSHIPEAVLPFTYNTVTSRHAPQFSPRPDYSPQESPQVLSSTSLPPYRPMIPPPGFTDTSPGPFSHGQNHTQNRTLDSPSAPFSRIVEPPGLTANLGFNRTMEPPPVPNHRYGAIGAAPSTSFHSHSPLNGHSNIMPNPNVGVIGSRSTSNKLNNSPSPASTPTPSVGSGTGNTSATTNAQHGLGNGAVGVDWNMWARSGR